MGERPAQAVDKLLQLGRTGAELARGAEQALEQRDQHHQDKAVEHRGEKGDDEPGGQQPPVGPHQPQQATLGLHASRDAG
jgi:hypothetical protein